MSAPAVRFDPARHRYYFGDVEVPGITKVLRLAGFIDESRYAPGAADRGRAVHFAIQLLGEGDLDETTLSPGLIPYLDAWRLFVESTGWVDVEKPEMLVSSSMGFATQIDRVGTLAAHRDEITVVNIKSGSPEDWWPVQAAGEAIAYAETAGRPLYTLRRLALCVRADGTYRPDPHHDRADYDTFQGALTVASWFTKHRRQKED